jgi:hypothetical protein
VSGAIPRSNRETCPAEYPVSLLNSARVIPRAVRKRRRSLHVVGEQVECGVRGERADRAEVAAVQGEHGIGAVLGGERDV